MRFDAIGNSGTNCGGEGSCGTCLVAITAGNDLLLPPKSTEAKVLLKQGRPARWRWSCRTVSSQLFLFSKIRARAEF